MATVRISKLDTELASLRNRFPTTEVDSASAQAIRDSLTQQATTLLSH